ncbi:MAG: FtsK protein, partial [Chloroflexota bacterium]|nr:FtsK protein [Chloroflexota bacterium]
MHKGIGSRNQAIGLALLVAGLIALLLLLPGLLGGRGPAPLRVLFGWGAVGVLLAAVLGGVVVLFADKLGWQVRWPAVAAAEVIFLGLLAALHLGQPAPLAAARAGAGGGLVGWALSQLLLIVLPLELAWLVIALITAGAAGLFWRGLPPVWTGRPVAWLRGAGAFVRGLRPPRAVAPARPAASRPPAGLSRPAAPPPESFIKKAGRLAVGAVAFIRQLAGGMLQIGRA